MIELADLDVAARAAELERYATAEARRPFDLTQGPLLRVSVLRLDAEEHLALLVMHHSIADGWSLTVLLRELAALYAARTTDQAARLPELSVQYADYAVWQRGWLQGEVLQRQLAYWRQQLSGVPQRLELPTDRLRPPVQSANGAHYRFLVPQELVAQLEAVGRTANATLFMVLLAAYDVLLARYSRQDDIVVGTPVAGRTQAVLEPLIGFFVNSLALRVDLAGNPTFAELLARVRAVCLDAYAHQDVPFEMVVEAVQPARDLSHTPLFQTMLVLDNAPQAELRLPGLTLRPVPAESGTARFDLTLELMQGPEGLHSSLEYNTDLFDAATVERMMRHFITLLGSIAAAPGASIGALELLDKAERQVLLTEWVPAPPPTSDARAHDRIVQQVQARPDAVALVADDAHLTYAALHARAARLAPTLQQHGAAPDTLVALALPRGLDLPVAALATWLAGAAFLPLDLSYPPARLQFMLADAQPAVLVTLPDDRPATTEEPQVAGWGAAVARFGGAVVTWGSDGATDPLPLPDDHATPDHLAYCIYTSGSTGQPKGTLLAHRGLVQLAQAQPGFLGNQPGSRVLQFAPLGFDAAVWELVMALTSGATLVIPQPDQLADTLALRALLQAQAVTHATLPPALLAVLPPDDLPTLQTVIAAGEACSQAMVARWAGGRTFVNAYGPTETTVCASWARCTADDPRPPAIGRALPHTPLYVLDATGGLAPIGVPGELYIGGVALARGYLGRPDLTAAQFVPNPFAAIPARRPTPDARLYKTGDLVCWRADGQLAYLGRRDRQIKLRGFRIELGEIEAALRELPGVQDALVMAQPGGGEVRLVGYVVPTDARARDLVMGEELRAGLAGRLPGYMVPRALVVVGGWPRTPAGKVDRGALPEPDWTRAGATNGAVYVAPRTATEAAIAEMCAAVLGLETVGVEDNFFALGGHSLLATQVLARVRQALGVTVPLRALFEQPTVAALAAAVEQAQNGASEPQAPAIVPLAREARRVKRSKLS